MARETRHHIIPKSRGGGLDYNIAMVTEREHQNYHNLFGNRTPDECLYYLWETFWTPTKGYRHNED